MTDSEKIEAFDLVWDKIKHSVAPFIKNSSSLPEAFERLLQVLDWYDAADSILEREWRVPSYDQKKYVPVASRLTWLHDKFWRQTAQLIVAVESELKKRKIDKESSQ